jgi:hypothetical protein
VFFDEFFRLTYAGPSGVDCGEHLYPCQSPEPGTGPRRAYAGFAGNQLSPNRDRRSILPLPASVPLSTGVEGKFVRGRRWPLVP